MSKFVYHGSQIQNLTEIIPHNNGVFAAKDKISAALYMMRRGPGTFSRTFGHVPGNIPFVAERYKNSFDDFYDGVSGSLYVLNANDFDISKPFPYVSSDKPQKVIQEIKVANVKDFLLEAENADQLRIFRYPSLPAHVPQDGSDLVNLVLKNPRKLQEFKNLFPDLYAKNKDRFEAIESN